MTGFKTINQLTYLVLFLIIAISCGKEDNNLKKATDFIPEIKNYDFYIEGEIENKLLHYK